jgi:hypothetical protein
MKLWREEADRLATIAKERWSEFRRAWPALRKTLAR